MNTTQTIDLYTQKDINNVREILLAEQDNKCACLGINILPKRTPVLDHKHDDDQLVRSVLEREVNAMLGVVENAHKRFLGYWLPMELPEVLRRMADYVEASGDTSKETRWRHPGWLAKLYTKFCKLSASDQNLVLESLHYQTGSNSETRKKIFHAALRDKNLGYTRISKAMKNALNNGIVND